MTERIVSINSGIESIACDECKARAKKIVSLPALFSEDFAIAKDYERRKKSEPPIHGSASHPDTEPPSTKLYSV